MIVYFDIEPFIGALPVKFGMSRNDVHDLLGMPESSQPRWDKSGYSDYWNESSVNVGFSNDGVTDHIGFCPRGCELLMMRKLIWSSMDHPDPNPALLQLDAAPVEVLGFLVFTKLGVTTTGYHDGDDAQGSLTVWPVRAWDEYLKQGVTPELRKYR